jgi:hypothetical protein
MRGVQKLEGGWPKMADFARGRHYPWVILALRVTGIVPLPLSGPVHSATHERAVTCWDSVRSPGEARLRSGTRHTRFRSTSVSGPSVAGGSKKKALVPPAGSPAGRRAYEPLAGRAGQPLPPRDLSVP